MSRDKELLIGQKEEKAYTSKTPTPVKMSVVDCKKLCKAVRLKYLDGYEERVVEHVISDETTDRAGDILRAKGCDFVNYQKNPTVLFAHARGCLPIGKSLKAWVEGKKVKSWGLYLDNRVDTSGWADLVFKMTINGALPAVSVAFLPKEINNPATPEEREKLGLGRWGVEVKEWELLEYSACSVPVNPNALQNAIKSKSLSLDNCDLMIKENLIEEELVEKLLVYKNAIEEKETLVVLKSIEAKIDKMSEFTDKLNELKTVLSPLLVKSTSTLTVPECDDDHSDFYSVFDADINI